MGVYQPGRLLINGVLESAFVERVLGKKAPEKGARFLANLLTAAREGHLCLRADEDPELPEDLPAIHRDDDRFYLRCHWDRETKVVEAIKTLGDRLSIITGGPGTGKTYTARRMAEGISNVAMAAPTGKAASNLPGAKTLHALLAESLPIQADLVIVDEASMIDVDLMARLLTNIKKDARLILVGDADQLPPIEAGTLFADLVQALPNRVTRLTKHIRQENPELIELAEHVRAGNVEAVLASLKDRITDDPIAHARKHWGPSFRVLAPMRHEVDRINQALYSPRAPVPIMITKNDYSALLFNGEVGTLENGIAHFGERRFPQGALPPYDLAYCLSVHKSQGSEFDHVFFVANPGAEIFGRELLYTALTRAKKRLDIAASDDTLRAMIQKRAIRHSGLAERLS